MIQWHSLTTIGHEWNSDTDNEEDQDFFLARLSIAQTKLKAKDFKAAVNHFEACLADGPFISTLPEHERVDLQLDLATACKGSGNNARQLSILSNLLKLDLPETQKLHRKQVRIEIPTLTSTLEYML